MIHLGVFFLAAAAVAVAVYGLIPDQETLAAIRSRQQRTREIKSPILRIFGPLLTALSPTMSKLGSERYRNKLSELLKSAGLSGAIEIEELLALKFILSAALVFFCLVYRIPLIFSLMIAGFGFFFPELWLRDQAKERKVKIRRDLPFMLDLLTLLVEAGLEFTAALTLITDKLKEGALRQELRMMLREFRVGAPRVEALQNLADRVNIPEINSLTAALIQASVMGTSIGNVLRVQSEIMRAERFTTAEKKGAEAAQKIMVPLILFILPATLIVILGPVLIKYLLH